MGSSSSIPTIKANSNAEKDTLIMASNQNAVKEGADSQFQQYGRIDRVILENVSLYLLRALVHN